MQTDVLFSGHGYSEESIHLHYLAGFLFLSLLDLTNLNRIVGHIFYGKIFRTDHLVLLHSVWTMIYHCRI